MSGARFRAYTSLMTRFDVALSFAGEDRAIAEELAEMLKQRGVKVFYDDEQQASLLGENLFEYLTDLYSNRSSFCVVIVSQHYVRKRWTRLEWRATQERALQQIDDAYVLPLRLDDAHLPGLLSTTGYLDLRDKPLPDVVNVVANKVEPAARFNRIMEKTTELFHAGLFDEVIRLLEQERSTREFMADRVAIRFLADAYMMVGEYQKPLPLLEKVTRDHFDDTESRFLMAVCYMRLGQLDKAEPLYEEVVARVPHHGAAQHDLEVIRSSRTVNEQLR